MLFIAEEQAAERLPNERDAGDIMWCALWRLPLQGKKGELWAGSQRMEWNLKWSETITDHKCGEPAPREKE